MIGIVSCATGVLYRNPWLYLELFGQCFLPVFSKFPLLHWGLWFLLNLFLTRVKCVHWIIFLYMWISNSLCIICWRYPPPLSSIDSFVTQRYMSTYGVLPSPSTNSCVFLSPGNISLVCCHSNGSDKEGRILSRSAYWSPAS